MTEQGTVDLVRQRVAALGPAADRDPAVRDELHSLLARVPRERRDRRWREASILVDLAFRQRPGRAFAQLVRMRRRQNDVAGFQTFWAECSRIMAPYTLGQHGYRLALAGREQQELWLGVAEIVAGVADLGHECFVNSGSLLGLVREGALIAHDDDVDLAVVLSGTDAACAAEEWLELRGQLVAAGLVDRDFAARRQGHVKVRLPMGLTVDLFPAWASQGRMYVWPYTYGDVAVEDVLPLVRREVAGTELWFPRRPERLLEVNYGPDWRTPDPTFRFDWGAARARFEDFVHAMGWRRGASGE